VACRRHKSLSALKEQGYKVGKLKFKGMVNSIPLKQFNNSYYIRNGKVHYLPVQPLQPFRYRNLKLNLDTVAKCQLCLAPEVNANYCFGNMLLGQG
jgi:hypothetical protein